MYGIVPGFFLGNEANIPTYYASFLLLSAATLLGWIALSKHEGHDHYRLHWKGLALLFFAMSVDEVARGHELLIRPMRELLNTGGVFYFAWLIPGLIFLSAFGISYTKFLLHLPRKFQKSFVSAGGLYVGGAVGVEMLGGAHADQIGVGNIEYRMHQTLEESCELFGAIVFVYDLLKYIGRYAPSAELVVPKTSPD